MSGRSAYVRKKITQTREPPTTNNTSLPLTSASPSHHNSIAPSSFSSDIPDISHLAIHIPPYHDYDPFSHSSTAPTLISRVHRANSIPPEFSHNSSENRPTGANGYARARRPTVKLDGLSGIEKSGLRSLLDKKSEDVRRGLAKTFTFRNKVVSPPSSRSGAMSPGQAESAAAVRGGVPVPESASDMACLNQGDAFPYSPDSITTHGRVPAPLAARGNMDDPWETMTSRPAVGPSGDVGIRKWSGMGRPVETWNNLRRDPELWDPHGDVLVYLGARRINESKPQASFRVSSVIVETSGAPGLIKMMRDGATDSAVHTVCDRSGGSNGSRTRHGMRDNEDSILYEMSFTSPQTTPTEQLRFFLTTRNIFALLCQASLVGVSLFQALTDLTARLQAILPPTTDVIGTVIEYIQYRAIDDVRNSPDSAVSLLAWSEAPGVRWDSGWREFFVHCSGIATTHGVEALMGRADWPYVSHVTRALVDRASLEMQVRVQAAEDKLAAFSFDELWKIAGSGVSDANAAARGTMDRFRAFLVEYYKRQYGSWPPVSGSPDDLWLDRATMQSLVVDFGALYEYLVNRHVTWDISETRPSRKYRLSSSLGGPFEPDVGGVPVTDILVGFDNANKYPHIPHPYPLVPESVAPPVTVPRNRGVLEGRRTAPTAPPAGPLPAIPRNVGVERRVRLAYTESTNISLLGVLFNHSDLTSAFLHFERTDKISTVDPALARIGRWLLIYTTLQTLATISSDFPAVRYKENVPYHLSPQVKDARLPPWSGSSDQIPMAARHKDSFCWAVSRTWESSAANSDEVAEYDGDRRPSAASTYLSASNGMYGTALAAPGRSMGSVGSETGTLPVGASAAMSVVDDVPPGQMLSSLSSLGALPQYPMWLRQIHWIKSQENIRGVGAPSLRSAGTFGGSGGQHLDDGVSEYSSVSALPRRTLWSETGSGYARNSMSSASIGGGSVSCSVGNGSGGKMWEDNGRGCRMGVSVGGTMIRDFDALDIIDNYEP